MPSRGLHTMVPAMMAALLLTGAASAAPQTGQAPSLTPYNVTISHTTYRDRNATALELTDAEQKRLLQPGQHGGMAYAIDQSRFANGTIDVDIAGDLTGKGFAESRGFVGIAFHLSDNCETYDAVYLRMSNGTLNQPPPPAPRNQHTVQYIAHPDFHWYVSRKQFPGRYEKAAPVALGRWHHLRLVVNGPHLQVYVDNEPVLKIDDLKYAETTSPIALWVDNGSRGYFANLKITPSPVQKQ